MIEKIAIGSGGAQRRIVRRKCAWAAHVGV
jgi:hypothetical protein